MGLVSPAHHLQDAFNHGKKLPTALLAFPSPASVTDSLESPSLARAIESNRSMFTPGISRCELQATATITCTEPDLVQQHSVMTPPADHVDEDRMNLIVGGALAPQSVKRTHQHSHRINPGLRLPSFESMGIAAPHPDRYGVSGLDATVLTSLAMMQSELHGDIQSITSPADASQKVPGVLQPSVVFSSPPPELAGRAIHSPIQQLASALTPPAERDIDWAPLVTVTGGTSEQSEAENISQPAALPSAGVRRSTLTVPVFTSQAAPVLETSQSATSWTDGVCGALRKCFTGLFSKGEWG